MHWILWIATMTGVSVAGVAAALAYSKPTQASFKMFYIQHVATEGDMSILSATKLLNTAHYDLFICRLAIVGKKPAKGGDYFLGTFGNWFSVEKLAGKIK